MTGDVIEAAPAGNRPCGTKPALVSDGKELLAGFPEADPDEVGCGGVDPVDQRAFLFRPKVTVVPAGDNHARIHLPQPFGARSIAVKIAPAGIDAPQIERMLQELLDQLAREEQAINIEKIRVRIAASIACHAAIKVNMPLEHNKMAWLIAELAKTECPMSCPHGRPVVLRYSLKDIQKAFKRI